MPDLKAARLMLALAQRDLRTVQNMLNTADFTDDVFGFHAQQCAEKSFKAWIACLSLEYPPIHDLKTLYDILCDQGETSVEAHKGITSLTSFAVQFRYAFYDDEPVVRPEIIAELEKLVDRVECLITQIAQHG